MHLTRASSILLTMLVTTELLLYIALRHRILPIIREVLPSDLDPLETEVAGVLIVFGATALANAVVLFLVKVGDAWLGRANRGHLQTVVDTSLTWLAGSDVHWGPRHQSTDRRVANTAEGLIAALGALTSRSSTAALPAWWGRIIRNAQQYMCDVAMPSGLPSTTLTKPTVHCTAMGLFALEKARHVGLTQEPIEAVRLRKRLHRILVNCNSEYGWAFVCLKPTSRNDVRMLSTLWALRALNAHAGNSPAFCDIASRLIPTLGIGNLGFRHRDTRQRVSMLALYVLLLSELRNSGLRARLGAEALIAAALPRLLSSIARHNCIEIEEYEADSGAIEKLSWVHVGEALALEALATCSDRLSLWQQFRIRLIWKRAIVDQWDRRGCFLLTTDTDVSNPQVFPTAYFLMALSKFLAQSLNK